MSICSAVGTVLEIGGSKMFDKMIISDKNGEGSKGRSRYFLVTSGLVAIMFATTVVLSIYAVDLNLGTDDFELSMMLAPVTPVEPEPKPEPEPNQPSARQNSEPTRVLNMLRLDEPPREIPNTISNTPNKFRERPEGRFNLGPVDSADLGRSGTVGTGTKGPSSSSDNGSGSGSESVAENTKLPGPPPAIKPKPTGPISLGVVNGNASSLPKPPYPAAAIAVNAQGEVVVQVTIDETGKVVSAKAAKGHPILKPAAERAAWQARFTPTLLSGVPVKVTGVIVYNFKRS